MTSQPEPVVSYGMSARDYLARARDRLDEGSRAALFYAAFELRCGVESRMREYLRAQKTISESKKDGWRIAKLAKDIEAVFKSGDKYVEIGIIDPSTGQVLRLFIYTPVRANLRSAAERLGDLLHAARQYRADSDPWWQETRAFLEETWRELYLATRGELLGVPLIEKATGQLQLQLQFHDRKEEYQRYIRKGTAAILGVKYHDQPPPSLGAV